MSAHAAQHPPRPRGSIWPMFLGGFILLLLFFGATQALRQFGPKEPSWDEIRAAQRREIRDKAWAEAELQMTTYAWIDKEKGIVQIPVRRAMELTVARLQASNEIKPAGYVDPIKALAEQQAAQPSAPAQEPSAPAAPAEPAPAQEPPAEPDAAPAPPQP